MTREVTTCDICGKEIDLPEFNVFSLNDVKLFKHEAIVTTDYNGNHKIIGKKKRIDICKDCMDGFKQFVKEV